MAVCHYGALALSRAASLEDIKKAYKKAALAHHPDKGGNPEEFKKVSAAAAILTDARKRREYDNKLRQLYSSDGLGVSSVYSAGLASRTGNTYQADLSSWFAAEFKKASTKNCGQQYADHTHQPSTKLSATPPGQPNPPADVKATPAAMASTRPPAQEYVNPTYQPSAKLGAVPSSPQVQTKPSAMASTPPTKVRASVSSDSPEKAAANAWLRAARVNIGDEKHSLPLKRSSLDSLPVRNVKARCQSKHHRTPDDSLSSTRSKNQGGDNKATRADQDKPTGHDSVPDRRPIVRRMGASHLHERALEEKKQRIEAEVARQEMAKSATAKGIAESRLGSVMNRIRARVQKSAEAA